MGRLNKQLIGQKIKQVTRVFTRRRTADEMRDFTMVVGLLFLFAGCWLAAGLGVSFIVCGGMLIYLALGAPMRGK